MAQPTVTISSPIGNTPIPCTASGTAFPSAGRTLVGMGYQIDTNPIHPFTTFVATGGAWHCTLTTSDCPVIGAHYLLTVYAGEDSAEFNTDAVTIVRTS